MSLCGDNKMKILFYIGNLKKGGAERVVANLSNEFIKTHDVIIVTTTNEKYEYEIDKRIKTYSLNDGINNNIIKKNLNYLKKLSKIINEENTDVAIGFLPEPSYRLLMIKNKIKCPIIISVRNDPKIEYNKFLSKLLMKTLYKKADGFVFQTKEAQDFFSKKIQKKSTIIPNAVDKSFIKERFFGERDKSIVTVGRLQPQKNHKLLIDSFNLIKDDFKEYKLLIYGKGTLEDSLKNYVKQLNLTEKVIFKGESNNIKDEIYRSNLFVLSSDYEGMPNALIEAMALGVPVVSTDCPCGGPRFLIENEVNGLLVPVNDIESMVKAIKRVLLDKQIANRISTEANKIGKTLNPENISEKWLKFIKKTIN